MFIRTKLIIQFVDERISQIKGSNLVFYSVIIWQMSGENHQQREGEEEGEESKTATEKMLNLWTLLVQF